MQSKFDGYMKTRTFYLVDRLPKGRKPVSFKWCFDYKTDKEGKITKFKARLVARGFTKIRDVDYRAKVRRLVLVKGWAYCALMCHQQKRTFGGWRTCSRDLASSLLGKL